MILSQLAGLYFIYVNTTDFLSSGTTTSLESSTEPLDDVFFPSFTICNLNQVTTSWFNQIGELNAAERETVIRYIFLGPENKVNIS